MRSRRPSFRDPRKLVTWLFEESAAGVQISGDSGSGKSNAMEVLAQALAPTTPFLFLDPHGLSARRLYRYCLSRESLRRRVIYIQPSDTNRVVSIHPLAMPTTMDDELAWYGVLANKCEMVARILLTAWGERDFASRPRLFTWVYRILDTLGRVGMSLADARLFLDTNTPLFQTLVQVVPDLMSRHAFEELARMRPSERDEQIESTRTRFLGFLSNRIIEATLGKVDGALDLASLYREGAIIIVNLEQGGVLRESDQEILANLYLTEILHLVMNLPEEERRPYFVFIDELPVFASSAPLLTRALAQIRKFHLRIVAAHQGTNMFPERTEDRLLHAFVSQCRCHLYFRHQSPVDARFFGEIIALPSLDPCKVKHRLTQRQQYQDGHDLVVLTDTGENRTEADGTGGGQSQGTTDGRTWNDDRTTSTNTSRATSQDEELLRRTVTEARSETTGQRRGEGGSQSTQQTTTNNWTKTTTRGTTRTFKQTLVPRLRWRDIVMSIQFYTSEEQVAIAATTLAALATGNAIVHVSGQGVGKVAFPLADDPFARTPRFARRRESAHRLELWNRPEFDRPQAIHEQRRQLLDALLTHLRAIPLSGAARALGVERPSVLLRDATTQPIDERARGSLNADNDSSPLSI